MNLRVGIEGDRPYIGILFYSISIFLSTMIGALTRFIGTIYPANEILFFRGLVVVLMMLVFFWIKKDFSLIVPKRPKVLFIRSVIGFIAVICSVKCYTSLPMAQATTIIQTTPFFIAFFAWPLLGEKITFAKIIAIVVGFIGIMATINPEINGLQYGFIFGLATAFLRCFTSIFMRTIGKTDTIYTSVFFYSLACTILSGIWLTTNWVTPSLEHILIFLLMGVITFFSELSNSLGYRYAQAVILSPYSYFGLLWAAILGYFFCGEVPKSSIILGGSLIIGSGLYILYQEKNKTKKMTQNI